MFMNWSNLLSVIQLLEKGYEVLFEHKYHVIKDQNNKQDQSPR